MNTGEALLSLAIPFAYAIMFLMAFLIAATPAPALCSLLQLVYKLGCTSVETKQLYRGMH